jgi:muramidase (phage lysozyme)
MGRAMVAAAIAGGLAWLALRDAAASAAPADDSDAAPSAPDPFAGFIEVGPAAATDGAERAVAAFLYMIRAAEHTAATIAAGSEYGVLYGGRRFVDFSNHPVLTGEFHGVPLAANVCRAAGMSPGCVSTAAGAYQINLPTWTDVNRWGSALPDFSPASQDEAARRILDHDGITPLIVAGEFGPAIYEAAHRWASLPGSSAGQGGRSLAFVLDRIEEGLALA